MKKLPTLAPFQDIYNVMVVNKMSHVDKTEQLLRILNNNEQLQSILRRLDDLGVSDCYLGAGCIANTVWNVHYELPPETGIKDYDVIYYDSEDLSYEAEDAVIKKGAKLFKDIPILVEIVNQARVHLWYEKQFGYKIKPYGSMEDAVKTWPTTATSIAINYSNNRFKVIAPYGLDDLLNIVVRANKTQITKGTYQKKIERWVQIWPNLKVLSWEQS